VSDIVCRFHRSLKLEESQLYYPAVRPLNFTGDWRYLCCRPIQYYNTILFY